MKKTPRKKIPSATLKRAHDAVSAPRKTLHKHTLAISEGVKRLRAAIRHKHGEADAWQSLRDTLDKAAAAGEWSAIDDFAALWEGIKIASSRFTLTIGNGEPLTIVQGKSANKPRSPVTLALIKAIENLQAPGGLNRAPNRQEILEEMALAGFQIEDAELCRQLKKLGWQKLI
jgi:hypothetical protein